MSKTRRIEFLERLANLLQEYNAEIKVDCDEGSCLDGLSLVINVWGEEVFEDIMLSFNGKWLKYHIEHIQTLKEDYEDV